jgi:hypothetical protein
MQHADGELEPAPADAEGRAKVAAVGELGELVRGHLELAADAVPARRFDAMWREIDQAVAPAAAPGLGARISRWFERYRGHLLTGVVSAGAVAAIALVLRPSSDRVGGTGSRDPMQVTPAAYRPTEIESLDTPGGTGTVFNLKDEDGSTTVIWVTPEDTVEGI